MLNALCQWVIFLKANGKSLNSHQVYCCLINAYSYVNMDFCFLSSLHNTALRSLVVSYDIVCQWSIHLWERMRRYPHDLHINTASDVQFQFLVPKFHLPAHIMACQTKFSFNFNHNVGRTDGEAPERGWSHINPVALSTREMGPGHRRDTLDDHFGDWNWKKTCLMGEYSWFTYVTYSDLLIYRRIITSEDSGSCGRV